MFLNGIVHVVNNRGALVGRGIDRVDLACPQQTQQRLAESFLLRVECRRLLAGKDDPRAVQQPAERAGIDPERLPADHAETLQRNAAGASREKEFHFL